MYQLVDYVSREHVNPDNLVFTGDETPWEVIVDLEEIRKHIDIRAFKEMPASLHKYLPFIPLEDTASIITLNEGNTPLMQSRRLGEQYGINLQLKLESRNPTGAFKDRGSAVEISLAKQLGANGVVVASTGNMAASCACYAAAAGIPCYVFIPEGVPQSKLAQVLAFGGRIVQVQGTYNEAERLAKAVARHYQFYLCGDYAYRLEGAKTAAYEVLEQCSFQAPDAVVVPMGCGTNLAAYAKGFQEWYALGLIDHLPALVGVQASGASAIVDSFHRNERSIQPLASVSTLASAIAVPNPLDGVKALDALYATNGMAISVTDEEIVQGQMDLARAEGVFVEPSGGAVSAACKKLSSFDRFSNAHVVGILCGDGLKDPSFSFDGEALPLIRPECNDFVDLYTESGFESPMLAA